MFASNQEYIAILKLEDLKVIKRLTYPLTGLNGVFAVGGQKELILVMSMTKEYGSMDIIRLTPDVSKAVMHDH